MKIYRKKGYPRIYMPKRTLDKIFDLRRRIKLAVTDEAEANSSYNILMDIVDSLMKDMKRLKNSTAWLGLKELNDKLWHIKQEEMFHWEFLSRLKI